MPGDEAVWGAKGRKEKRAQETSQGDGHVIYFDCDDGSQVYTYVETYQLYTLNMYNFLNVNYILIKLKKDIMTTLSFMEQHYV